MTPPDLPEAVHSDADVPAGPGRSRTAHAAVLALLTLLATLLPAAGRAQEWEGGRVGAELLAEVLPDADRFGEKEGEPPVYRAFRSGPEGGSDRLVGYAFLTPDLPPEVVGYLGAIDVLVGMDLDGTITGVRVLGHREPLAHSRKGFFQEGAFLRQFAGKPVSDPFRLESDLRGISGATISVDAMARGVRNAARRVASTYLAGGGGSSGRHAPLTAGELEGKSWYDLVAARRVERLVGEVDGMVRIQIFFAELEDEAAAEALLGSRLMEILLRREEEGAAERTPMFLGLDAQNLAWFRPSMFFVIQDGDTVSVRGEDVTLFERLRGSSVEGQLGSAGIWRLDERIDPSRPFTVGFGGDVGVRIATVTYGEPSARRAAAPPAGDESATAGAGPDEAAAPVAATGSDGGSGPGGTDEGPAAGAAGGAGAHGGSAAGETVAGGPPASSPPEAARRGEVQTGTDEGAVDRGPAAGAEEAQPRLDFSGTVVEESRFRRTLARASWSRVGGLLLLLALTSLAFYTRSTRLRWITLAGTVLFLGFADKGFLSISHVSSGIVVGPDLFVSDLSLLVLTLFTVVTVLLWGRVFCGYLCPFGALQDVLERLVPDRLQRRMPAWIHDRAIWLKYGFLAVVLVPALAEATGVPMPGRDVSVYAYLEPFGTVFFPSKSVLLWAIALAFLAASAIVPRFYCRYVCPLGAALAVVSRISPFRIERVEQCTLCSVCEQDCPTGAIRQEEVDFPECVRCSVCEVNLREEAGTCRHDMEEIRPRLVQMRTPSGSGSPG